MSATPSTTPATTPQRLVVKITCGPEALERLNQGLTVAATAAASGVEVSLWLTGDASWVAVPGRAEELVLPHAAPLSELRDAVLAAGSVTVCGQCAARRDLTDADLLPGAQVRGAAAFVEEVMAPDTRALVY
ncbi:DsrE family protein [Phycicoccus sp. SLBN-51]|uniref:DsrE family protein n=1 Tax=Phycicoccus sp. SLBN-51 TaxID=2768447 RepID=UPI00114F6A94|nr:DsrE family protein [Phycicoccus sp. SLBN-51]TQJ48522.1 putative peroxiredoxin [Phycicoccus sp. SLBN-51]